MNDEVQRNTLCLQCIGHSAFHSLKAESMENNLQNTERMAGSLRVDMITVNHR
jgi:hypothetical protein